MKFLENLRGAPNETKKSFAVVVSVFATFVIVGFSLAVSNPLSVKEEKDITKTAEEKLPSPFSALTSQIGASFTGLKNDLLPLKEMISAVKEQMASTTPKIASSTISVVTTTTSKIATTTKPTKAKPVPVVIKKVEPPQPKYGPFLISGVKVKKIENMGASAVMTIGKTITTDSTGSPQAKTTQASSTTEIKTATSTQN